MNRKQYNSGSSIIRISSTLRRTVSDLPSQAQVSTVVSYLIKRHANLSMRKVKRFPRNTAFSLLPVIPKKLGNFLKSNCRRMRLRVLFLYFLCLKKCNATVPVVCVSSLLSSHCSLLCDIKI